jgi:predicted nucleotidyltransferase
MNKYSSAERVLRELFSRPTYKFHIRELARLTKLNPNTVINVIKALEKEGIVKKKRKKHIVEILLDLENKKTVWKKRIFNIAQIYNSGIVEFLVGKYSPASISLIGSYSRGEDIEKSDIDIVVIAQKKETADIKKFEKILNKSIHLLLVSREKMSEEFFNNLINGIVLYGAVNK